MGLPGTGVPGTANGGTAGSADAGGASSAPTGGGASDDSIGSQLSSALSTSLSTNAAELAVVRESETLKIQLTDGTQVTIRVGAQGAELGAAQTQADGSSSSAAAVFSSGQLQIAVNGNLSSADQQAISDVVSQVNALASQFFSGDVQDAFAAAASLNVDPTEIASFSMKLSYASALFQQAGASDGTSSPATSTADPSSAAASAPASQATPGDNTTSPQRVIIDFVQHVMTRLGRGGSGDSQSHSQLGSSSRWKLHLFAQALPTYAQAQAGAAAQGAASAPQVATNRYPTLQAGPSALQAAKLAADTLSQLAQ